MSWTLSPEEDELHLLIRCDSQELQAVRMDIEASTLKSVVAMPHPAPLARGSHVETDATVLTSCVTPINIYITVNLCSQLD